MKLTTGQAVELRSIYNSQGAWRDADLQAIADAYLKMLTESREYAVIKAPAGMRVFRVDAERMSVRTVHFEPIPEPCPAPVLSPVTVTVESVYSPIPPIPEGYAAEFGDVEKLIEKGFTQFISDGFWIVTISAGSSTGLMRICLKKWESL